MPAPYSFTIVRGDDVAITLVQRDETNTPLNITGRTYAAQMRRSSESASVAASFTCTVTDGAAGTLVVSLGDSVTAGLALGDYAWDLQETASGTVTTLLSGTVTVDPDVTR